MSGWIRLSARNRALVKQPTSSTSAKRRETHREILGPARTQGGHKRAWKAASWCLWQGAMTGGFEAPSSLPASRPTSVGAVHDSTVVTTAGSHVRRLLRPVPARHKDEEVFRGRYPGRRFPGSLCPPPRAAGLNSREFV